MSEQGDKNKKPETGQGMSEMEAKGTEANADKGAPAAGGKTGEEAQGKAKATPTGRARPASGARPRPAGAKKAEEKKPEEPSPMQPLLEQFVARIKEGCHPEAVVEAYINRPSGHIPTLVIDRAHWSEVARFLKEDEALAFDYMRNLSSVDYETHLEVCYQLVSFAHQHQVAVRVKVDREEAVLPTVSHVWAAAGWNEREAYDLMGIHFTDHSDLRRILLPDDWVGHPLRKDYEPLDKEV
ncbi:NADH-quinone oxidoreductase subunit C [Laceyella sacchari]|uniref:NADH-quinone oxidoreductase n=1 Tax=Laceyella tengchongensis TaxID=574699 RepID=A0AA45WQK7_9BACL|nr:NADH-quinone oxidoreductase subunit C [Laceyella tengchongensis]AUS10210.1 NADH-quinone oxidoreductase subunit C [Laceyella sacchari]SMP26558.1 NADH-quinone oxidoreductase subunit C [Laceyella tengchongensis]